MDSKEQFGDLKRSIAASIDRAKQNVEGLHVIENALQENLQKLKELRKSQNSPDRPAKLK